MQLHDDAKLLQQESQPNWICLQSSEESTESQKQTKPYSKVNIDKKCFVRPVLITVKEGKLV